jgi:hypothetical protein
MTGSSGQYCLKPGTTDVSKFNNKAWSCSNAYADRAYAKYVCQINTNACGTVNTFDVTTTNSTIAIDNLSSG